MLENKVVAAWKKYWKKERPVPIILRFETTGAPDFLLLREKGECTFFEFKRPGGTLRPSQKRMIPLLKSMGYQVEIVDNLPPESSERFIRRK